MSEKLKIVYRPLQELSPYAHNARTHSPEQVAQLVESIKQFGWTNPVLIDEKGEIIAGHPVCGAVCQAVIAGIVSHRVAQTHSRKGVIKEAAAQCIPVEQLQIIITAAQNVLGVIRVNRRITFTVEGEVQRGSQADDIHPVSLFTHPGVFAPGVAPAHARQAMQRQYRTVETGEGEGESLAQGEVGTFVAVRAGYRIDRICYPSDDFIGNTF